MSIVLLAGPESDGTRLTIGACVLLGGARPGVLGLAVAAWIAAGFLLVFASLARHDLRVLREVREAACVVTDTGRHSHSSGRGRYATTFAEPFVALLPLGLLALVARPLGRALFRRR